jgi:hypothetical protein
MKRIVGLYIAWLIAAVMLIFAAVERHPYSFYTLLRWICCSIFAYSAFAGKITLYKGKPEIIVNSPSQISSK